jgi:hypothetical protein
MADREKLMTNVTASTKHPSNTHGPRFAFWKGTGERGSEPLL